MNRVTLEMDEDDSDPDSVWVNEFVHREWTYIRTV
jgi:hypothetical protein